MYFSSYDHAETQIKAVIGLGKLINVTYMNMYVTESVKPSILSQLLSQPLNTMRCYIPMQSRHSNDVAIMIEFSFTDKFLDPVKI